MKQVLSYVLQTGTLVWAGAIFFYSILKAPIISAGSDVILHFTAYLFLAFLAIHAFKHKIKTLPIIVTVIGYGIILEVLQNFSGRSMSVFDALANTLGAIIATAIVKYGSGQNFYKINTK